MNSARMRLKSATGWFAAGREVSEAMGLLSDTAFKLFMWLCLNADRRRGTIVAIPKAMAGALGKTEAEITQNLDNLFQAEICCRRPDGWVEITDRFWPYQRAAPSLAAQDAHAYAASVRELMLARHCVRSVFSAADHNLAVQLHRRGVSLQVVERAIHLGCLRKYAALLNNRAGTPITSLHYFTSLFSEVQELKISADYWGYVAFKLRKLEQMWTKTSANLTEKLETK